MSSFRVWLDIKRNWWIPFGEPAVDVDSWTRKRHRPDRMEANMDGIGEVSNVRTVRQVHDGVVVILAGDVDMRSTPVSFPALTALVDKSPQRMVLNLEKVAYLDSSGLGMLIELFRRMRAYGGRLLLCCVPEQVRGVIEITRVDRFFPIFASEAEALAG